MNSLAQKCYTPYWPEGGSVCPATLHFRLHVVPFYSRGHHPQRLRIPLIVAGNICIFKIYFRITKQNLFFKHKWLIKNIWSGSNGPKQTHARLADDLLQWLTWVRVFSELINISRAVQEALLGQMWPSGRQLVITGLVSFESLSLLQFKSDYNIQRVVKGIRAICVSL